MMMPEYEIGRGGIACAATGVELKPGDPVVSILVEREGDEGYERLDYSESAWEGGQRPQRVFALWRCVIPEPSSKPRMFIDEQTLTGLFEQLAESDDPKRMAFRYVLALLMMRKRLATYVGPVSRGPSPGMLVRLKGAAPEEPPVEVPDPGLDEETISHVTEQIQSVLRLEK